MNIYTSTIQTPAALLGSSNPLPVFRDADHNKALINDGLLEDETQGFGYEIGYRVLPYMIQDNYTRELSSQNLPVIVMENDHLKAVFLTGFGGRLWSLYDKDEKKELLFSNPAFRIANLAIRNAWFSGGIEWNIGQYGHTCLTCEPVFFARCTDSKGQPFLRMYEYERQKGLFYQIDFHLPDDSHILYAHVSFQNSCNHPIPIYWWTNIAVREEKRLRVVSSTDEVIYIKPNSLASEQSVHGFGHGKMPYLETLNGLDASFPQNLTYSNEYFFQNKDNVSDTWEVAAYDDGFAFWERSTSLLRYRKMFCWGNHHGGSHWKDFLSLEGQGDYVEIQGGLSPTQVHGRDMGANERWSFTQAFGSMSVDADKALGNWGTAKAHIKSCMEDELSGESLTALDSEFDALYNYVPDELLSSGSGWGALEAKRDASIIPAGMIFPEENLGAEQKPWLNLLEKGSLPCLAQNELPVSWMTDARWLDILNRSLTKAENQNWTAYLHLGVMLCENDRPEEARQAFEASFAALPTAICARNLAQVCARSGDFETACSYISKAIALGGANQSRAFAEEYIDLHNKANKHSYAWEFYCTLSDELKSEERIRLLTCISAFKCEKWDFLEEQFKCSFAVIREGESNILDLWYMRQAVLLAQKRGVAYSDVILKEAVASLKPPHNLDFRAAQ